MLWEYSEVEGRAGFQLLPGGSLVFASWEEFLCGETGRCFTDGGKSRSDFPSAASTERSGDAFFTGAARPPVPGSF